MSSKKDPGNAKEIANLETSQRGKKTIRGGRCNQPSHPSICIEKRKATLRTKKKSAGRKSA